MFAVVDAGEPSEPIRVVGRYALYGEIAAGGMATVHFGRLLGPVGFSRTVAIKRLHPQFAKDPEFVSMFLDEARLAARIRHPNVVPTLDVVATKGELFLVMDYVQGESLSRLIRTALSRGELVPVRLVGSIIGGTLHGLHAAHEAKNERGEPLRIVHRDISPQNVLVGADGIARVLDFGVAKAAGRIQTTKEGQLKGKLAYMAPEQIQGQVTRQTDIYAAAIVLWETLTGQRLFSGDNEAQILSKVLGGTVHPPSALVPNLPPGLDEIVLRGLAREPAHRWASAREFAIALERCVGVASPTEVGEWVEAIAHGALAKRAERIAEIESSSSNAAAKIDLGKTTVTSTDASVRTSVDLPVSQASQLSSISVSKSAVPMRSRTPLFVGLGIAALSFAVVSFVILARRGVPASSPEPRAPDPTASAASTIPAPPPASAAATAPPAAQPSTAVATATVPPTSASAAATTVAAKPAAHATHTTHAAHTAHTAAPAPTAAHPKNCDPPYTLDDKGHKIWKPECM
jgi:serine/threonine protein kinase